MRGRRLLVIDDSITMRAMIGQLFAGRNDIGVVGVARNATEALDALTTLDPDVLTLDIVMPGMDGFGLLAKIMRDRPMPVVIVSSTSTEGSDAARRAIALGAACCFDKTRILSDAAAFVRTVATATIGRIETC